MRVEPYDVDSYVHVVKRGARGLPISKDEQDQHRFMRLLYYLNDEYQSEFWEDDIRRLKFLERPKGWPERKPLVSVLAWTLMPNHFHLLLKEVQDDGISRFMQRLGGSMTRHFNEKYEEKGSIFQGAYRSRTVATDSYMRWAIAYVLVKNVFELYPGGLGRAVKEFEKAWKWGVEKYKYSSLSQYALGTASPIIDRELAEMMFRNAAEFKSCARDMVLSRSKMEFEGSVIFE